MNLNKSANFPFRHGLKLEYMNGPLTKEESRVMWDVPYTSAAGSLVYAMLCTRPNIFYMDRLVSQYQSNPWKAYWEAVKHIFKYRKCTRDYILVFGKGKPEVIGIQMQISSRISAIGHPLWGMCLL